MGLPEATLATWPNSLVQTCVVHLIRAAKYFVAYQDRKAHSVSLTGDLYRQQRAGRSRGPRGLRRLGPGPEVPLRR
ncbi:transposase [Trueperella abortisuis]|uniref:transposase n=1 Tax=Trueperella abortisuis TaxID=445930 RepID=UPI00389A43C0